MDGVGVDTAVLRDVAGRLEQSAGTVSGATPSASSPDAGRSTGEVTSARQYLDDHAARMSRSLANAAAALLANADAYDAQDAAAAARLEGSMP